MEVGRLVVVGTDADVEGVLVSFFLLLTFLSGRWYSHVFHCYQLDNKICCSQA